MANKPCQVNISKQTAMTARDELQKLLWDFADATVHGSRYMALIDALNDLENKLKLPTSIEPERHPVGFNPN